MNPIFSKSTNPFDSAFPADAPQATAVQDFGQHQDRDLTRRIVVFLASHGLLNGASVLLKVNNGHVELRGTVATFGQRDRVEASIRRVAGVHNVTNQLVVGTPPLGEVWSRLRVPSPGNQESLVHHFRD